MSVVADEAVYAGLKKIGRMDYVPWEGGESQGPTLIYIKKLSSFNQHQLILLSSPIGTNLIKVADEVYST